MVRRPLKARRGQHHRPAFCAGLLRLLYHYYYGYMIQLGAQEHCKHVATKRTRGSIEGHVYTGTSSCVPPQNRASGDTCQMIKILIKKRKEISNCSTNYLSENLYISLSERISPAILKGSIWVVLPEWSKPGKSSCAAGQETFVAWSCCAPKNLQQLICQIFSTPSRLYQTGVPT